MSHFTHAGLKQSQPLAVKRIIARGGGCSIGEINQTTVLKYSHTLEEWKRIEIEAEMFKVLGNHPRIIKFLGFTESGLLLEFQPHGNLYDYLTAHETTKLDTRMRWCAQAAEALDYIHSRRVLHCDIRHDNLLLDSKLDLKLADFQGQHFSEKGEILLDALSVESTKAYLPRTPADHASVRTDLFALGSAMYFILTGYEVFPKLDSHNDEEEIARRFQAGEFPVDMPLCGNIIAGCWKQQYTSARQVLDDLHDTMRILPSTREPRSHEIRPQKSTLPLPLNWLDGICEGSEIPRDPPSHRELVRRVGL